MLRCQEAVVLTMLVPHTHGLRVTLLERCPGCHPERSEGSASTGTEILSAAKDDRLDLAAGEELSRAAVEFSHFHEDV